MCLLLDSWIYISISKTATAAERHNNFYFMSYPKNQWHCTIVHLKNINFVKRQRDFNHLFQNHAVYINFNNLTFFLYFYTFVRFIFPVYSLHICSVHISVRKNIFICKTNTKTYKDYLNKINFHHKKKALRLYIFSSICFFFHFCFFYLFYYR